MIDSTPTGNSLLDGPLERIANAGETMNTKGWVEVLAREQAADIRQRAMNRPDRGRYSRGQG